MMLERLQSDPRSLESRSRCRLRGHSFYSWEVLFNVRVKSSDYLVGQVCLIASACRRCRSTRLPGTGCNPCVGRPTQQLRPSPGENAPPSPGSLLAPVNDDDFFLQHAVPYVPVWYCSSVTCSTQSTTLPSHDGTLPATVRPSLSPTNIGKWCYLKGLLKMGILPT